MGGVRFHFMDQLLSGRHDVDILGAWAM